MERLRNSDNEQKATQGPPNRATPSSSATTVRMGANSFEEQQTDAHQEVTADRVSSNGDQNGASVRSSAADSSTPHASSSSSSKPGGEDQPLAPAAVAGGTFPKPANFAEKIMHVLENNMEPEAIRWIDNGEAIAIHPEKAKQSKLLAKFFQMKSFPIFTRTLIRWGFMRLSEFELPHPLIGFRNSLFRRDKPFLVQYMKMDSDVQDVFAEHQRNLKRKLPTEHTVQAEGPSSRDKRPPVAAAAAAARNQLWPEQSTDSAQALPHEARGTLHPKIPKQGSHKLPHPASNPFAPVPFDIPSTATVRGQQATAAADSQEPFGQQRPVPNPAQDLQQRAAQVVLHENCAREELQRQLQLRQPRGSPNLPQHATMPMSASMGTAGQLQQPRATAHFGPDSTAHMPSSSGALGQPQQPRQSNNYFGQGATVSMPTSQGAPRDEQSRETSQEDFRAMKILQDLLQATKEFLALSLPNDPEITTLRALLEMLVVVGQRHYQYWQEVQQRQERPTPERDIIQQLVSHLDSLTRQQQQLQSSQPVQTQTSAPASLTQLLQNLLSQQQQTLPQQGSSTQNSNIVHQLQRALNQSSSQQQPMTLSSQLLRLLMQTPQQQHQQNQSPQGDQCSQN